jgi:hypothetical protein
MTGRALAAALFVIALGAPALAQAPAPAETPAPAQSPPAELSGVTVTPKAGPINPKAQCVDEACIKAVVQALKTRFPREYSKLMRWCMSSEAERMALKSSGWNTLLAGYQTLSTDPKAGEKIVCDDRFAKK